jgi:hypothetical protein
MVLRNIITIAFLLLFVNVINLYSYTLPKEADMLKLLPDVVGDWQVNRLFDFSASQIDDTSDPYYKESRFAVKMYRSGSKQITATMSALIPSPIPPEYSEDLEGIGGNEVDCKVSTKNSTIQGFKAIVESQECLNGMMSNSLLIEFVSNDDFYSNLNITSTTWKGQESFFGELASVDELVKFTNALNLKGMSNLIK